MAKETKPTFFLDLLTMEEVTNLYTHFSGASRKFKDRQDAETGLLNISFGKLRPTLIQAFKAVGIDDSTISQFNQMLRGPVTFPDGPMKEKDLKKHQQVLASSKKEGSGKASGSSDNTKMNATDAVVLLAVREMVPEGKVVTEEEKASNSTQVAEKLGTNVNAVCRSLERLAKWKLIEVEDDSNDEHPLFWINAVTPGGREMVVPTFAEKPKLPASNPGPRSKSEGKRIFRLVATNPRREGSFGWKSFNVIRDGMTVEEYRKAGGRNSDLNWDVDHGFLALRGEGEAAPEVPTEKAPAPVKAAPAPASEPEKPKAPAKETVKKAVTKLKTKAVAKKVSKKKKGGKK